MPRKNKRKYGPCPCGCGEQCVLNPCCLDEGDNCFVCGYSFPYEPEKPFFESHKLWRMRECPGDTPKFFKALGTTKEKAWKKA